MPDNLPTADSSSAPLLSVSDLRVYFDTDAGPVRAVDGISFEIRSGETLALVGESGCGKSVSAMAILRLIATPPGRFASGSIHFHGEDLLRVDDARIRAVRGAEIAMIFQEPMTSLNPVYTIGDQIVEAIELHQGLEREEAREHARLALARVGIPLPERRLDEYPHQMSGGMRQRAMIAMALACNPKLLIADEPTTALDVTIQAQILDLLRDLRRDYGMSILLITHDLGVVAEMAHRVVVMYAGKIAETAPVGALFERPRHPYTAGLFHSIPKLHKREDRLRPIEGVVPDALSMPPGCRFHPRCPFAMDICRREEPQLKPPGGEGVDRLAACWLIERNPGADLLGDPRAAEAAP